MLKLGPIVSPVEDSKTNDLKFNNTPNFLTLLRIVFVPILVGFLFIQKPFWDIAAAIAFSFASITDFFDGYIARSQKLVTVYGKLMDPLADKFLVISALIMLQFLGRIHPIITIILICREIAITGLRAMASAEGVIIPASATAKWKTATQMVAIPFMMIKPGLWGIPLFTIGQILLYISLLISLWSAFAYLLDFFKALRTKRKAHKEAKLALKQAKKALKHAKREAKRMRREARKGFRHAKNNSQNTNLSQNSSR